MLITSPQNPKIKNLVKLRRRRGRDRQKRMLIDGGRALQLALQNNVPLETIYFVPEQADADVLARARRQNVPLQAVSPAVFQKIGYGDNPDGLLGVAPQPEDQSKKKKKAPAAKAAAEPERQEQSGDRAA